MIYMAFFSSSDLPSDDLLHDFVASSVNGLDPGICVRPADGVLQHEPGPPVELQSLVRNLVLQVGGPGPYAKDPERPIKTQNKRGAAH